jgi:hypothetical protein
MITAGHGKDGAFYRDYLIDDSLWVGGLFGVYMERENEEHPGTEWKNSLAILI